MLPVEAAYRAMTSVPPSPDAVQLALSVLRPKTPCDPDSVWVRLNKCKKSYFTRRKHLDAASKKLAKATASVTEDAVPKKLRNKVERFAKALESSEAELEAVKLEILSLTDKSSQAKTNGMVRLFPPFPEDRSDLYTIYDQQRVTA